MNSGKANELRRAINQLPKVELAQLPTPLQRAPGLSQTLGGPQIFFKREDLTGLALGGNKTRMLEFRLAKALEMDADVVVSGFGVQSNHARQIVAASRKFGLEVNLILRKTGGTSPASLQGNLLLDLLMGAEVKIIEGDLEEQKQAIEEEALKLKERGNKPFVTGFDDEHLSAIAYVQCGLELMEQVENMGINPRWLFVASEGATQAGLVLHSKIVGSDVKIVGVNMVDWIENVPLRIAGIANRASAYLGMGAEISAEDVISTDDYVGRGYGMVTDECLKAIKLVAETEGILLDPVYTGKAMAALIGYINKGVFSKDDGVIFLHTGGSPALFAYNREFDFSDQIKF